MTTYPYVFGLGERGVPSDAAIANAESAAFEREASYLRDPDPRPCTDCGIDVAMHVDEGRIVPVAGESEGELVTCPTCVRLRCAKCGETFGIACEHRSFGDVG